MKKYLVFANEGGSNDPLYGMHSYAGQYEYLADIEKDRELTARVIDDKTGKFEDIETPWLSDYFGWYQVVDTDTMEYEEASIRKTVYECLGIVKGENK